MSANKKSQEQYRREYLSEAFKDHRLKAITTQQALGRVLEIIDHRQKQYDQLQQTFEDLLLEMTDGTTDDKETIKNKWRMKAGLPVRG